MDGGGLRSSDGRGGGGRSSDQSSLHINFIELETVFLALKRFQRWLLWRSRPGSDRQHYGDAFSEQGRRDQVQVLGLEGQGDYSLVSEHESAVHISGQDNVEADHLSQFRIENPRRLERSTEWSLDPRVTNLLFVIWGQPTVDLFTTQLNNKVEAFSSCLPDPLALQGNSLQADWSKDLLYMYPPVPSCPLLFTR